MAAICQIYKDITLWQFVIIDLYIYVHTNCSTSNSSKF